MKKMKKKVQEVENNDGSKDLGAHEGPEMPVSQEKRLIQAEVSLELFEAVHEEIKRKNIKIRQVLEFGLQYFLIRANKKEAERLGVKIVQLP